MRNNGKREAREIIGRGNEGTENKGRVTHQKKTTVDIIKEKRDEGIE